MAPEEGIEIINILICTKFLVLQDESTDIENKKQLLLYSGKIY